MSDEPQKKSLFSKKLKIFILGLSTVIALLIIVLQYTRSINETNTLQSAYVSVIELEATMLRLIRHEKDFQLQNKLRFKNSFNQTYQELDLQLKTIISDFNNHEISTIPFNNVSDKLKLYQIKFNQIAKKQEHIGFNENLGLWKKVVSSATEIEQVIRNHQNDILLAQYWLLRRHESEFLMHRNMEFQKHFGSRVQLFEYAILEQDISEAESKSLQIMLSKYQSSFTALVSEYQKLGLDQRSGLKGQLVEAELATEIALSELLEVLRHTLSEYINSEQIISVWNSAFLIIFVIFMIVLMLTVFNQKDTVIEEEES